MNLANANIQLKLSQILRAQGHTHFGFTRLARPLTIEFYQEWLDHGYSAEMSYLRRHKPMKTKPTALLPKAESAIVIAFNYLPHPRPHTKILPISKLKIARYAQGEDYHLWLKEELEAIIAKLKTEFPWAVFASYTDSSPVLERDLAYMAGLGWFGKNTCLIDKKEGSFFLIGEIYTSLELENTNPLQNDYCGTCNRCIEACPTQALSTRQMDAKKCISYLTIESKTIAPEHLRTKMQDWFFGCDICQEVCPWNSKPLKSREPNSHSPTNNSLEQIVAELEWILRSSQKEINQSLSDSPVSRASGWRLKRNAFIVIANKKLKSLEPLVSSYIDDERLSELALWTLEQIKT